MTEQAPAYRASIDISEQACDSASIMKLIPRASSPDPPLIDGFEEAQYLTRERIDAVPKEFIERHWHDPELDGFDFKVRKYQLVIRYYREQEAVKNPAEDTGVRGHRKSSSPNERQSEAMAPTKRNGRISASPAPVRSQKRAIVVTPRTSTPRASAAPKAARGRGGYVFSREDRVAGGLARKQILSKAQRKAIAQAAARKRWKDHQKKRKS